MNKQNKVWLITGAGRGMGVDITKAAWKAGHKVVATGRNTDSVANLRRTVTLSNRVTIESVSKMLGHTKITTTQVYASQSTQ